MADQPSILEFSEDLSTAEAPKPLPVGEYPATIRTAQPRESDKGNKYLSLGLYVSPDSYPLDFVEGDPDGTMLTFNRISLNDNPQSRYRLRKFLETIGASASRTLDVNDLIDLACTIRVKHGTWEGETRAEVDRIV